MAKREVIRTNDGQRLVVEDLLGTGGQGEVWRAQMDGRQVAVKLYHRHTATVAQRELIERLVQKGQPASYFLWPLALVEDPRAQTYGYVMDLREQRFRRLEDFMARRIEPTLRALLTAAWQLADGFLMLHSRGLCYRDISFTNVFFDPVNGDVRVCDNDNVDVSGTAAAGILGTPRFMAPEVVRREAVPSDQTDRYSLAVLLFYLLMGGHPLDGAREARIRCLDVPALEKLYGFEPVYIFDPDDASNRPVDGVHDNPIAFQPLYPEALLDLFSRSFTDGLHYPSKRVRESEWRNAFTRAIDAVVPCASCGAESFYDGKRLRAPGGLSCWSCTRTLLIPARIRLRDTVVMLTPGAHINASHIGLVQGPGEVVAEVVRNPRDPALLGLRNMTAGNWTLTRPDGSIVDVPPGRAAPITSGNVINFGPMSGEIRV